MYPRQVSVPSPIFSRIYQELSNGMLGYSQAARIAMVPFPDVRPCGVHCRRGGVMFSPPRRAILGDNTYVQLG